jgi:glycosyltransferase 2 family protein
VRRLRTLADSWLVRLAVTSALLAIVALQVDWPRAEHRVVSGNWGWFVAAVAAALVSLAIGAERWRAFLGGAGVHPRRLQVQRAYFVGVFSNAFLPTGFGGDAARTWIIGRAERATVRVAVSVLADRGTSLACGFLLAWIALAVAPGSVPHQLTLLLAATTAAGLVAAALALVALRGRAPALAGRLPERLRGWLRETRTVLLAFAGDRRLIAVALALGLLFQLAGTGAFWLLARVIGVEIPFAVVAASVSLVLVVTVLPISVAGFGVREGGFVLLLGWAGVSATDATVISLLSVVTLALASLPGALALLLRPRTGARRAAPLPVPSAATRSDGA